MNEKMKIFRTSFLTSIITLVLGLVFFARPLDAVLTFSRIVGIIFLVVGAVMILISLRVNEVMGKVVSIVPGVVAVILGIWILVRPAGFASILPIVFGIVMLYHGVRSIMFAVQGRGVNGKSWLFMLIVGIVVVLLGLLLILHPLTALSFSTRIIGAILIFDGAAGIVVNITSKANDSKKSKAQGPVDVDYKEV